MTTVVKSKYYCSNFQMTPPGRKVAILGPAGDAAPLIDELAVPLYNIIRYKFSKVYSTSTSYYYTA